MGKKKRSRKLISKLLRNDFDKVDLQLDYIYKKADKIIEAAYYYKLPELANEMKNDKK